MREILFRGKRKDNGKWIEGDLIHNAFDGICNHEIGIAKHGRYPSGVIPETIGQFTGLLDKNGVKIFEGDIVVIEKHESPKGVVIFEKGCFVINTSIVKLGIGNVGSNLLRFIGNIHDNPELIIGDL